MKGRSLLKISSILMIPVCVFGLLSGVLGVKSFSDDKAAAIRLRESKLEAIQTLEDGIVRLEEMRPVYEAGLETLAAGEEEYAAGLRTLEEGKVALAAGQSRLASGYAEYNAGQQTYNAGLAQYNEGKETLDANTEAYNEGKEKLETLGPIAELAQNFVEGYRDSGLNMPITGKIVELLDEKVVTTYVDGKAQLRQYEEGQAQLQEAEVALSSGAATLADAKAQLAAGESTVAAGKQELAAGEAKLVEGAKALEEGRAKLAEFEAGEAAVEAGKATLLENPVAMGYYKDGMDVVAAGRQAVADGTKETTAKLTARLVQYAILILASVLAACSGVLGISAAFDPSRGKLTAGFILGLCSFLLALGGNIYGAFNAYRDFRLQMLGLIAMAVMCYFLALSYFLCLNAYTASLKTAAALAAAEAEPATATTRA